MADDIRILGSTYFNATGIIVENTEGDELVYTASSVVINDQDKTVTPTESEQEITYDEGYTGLGVVTVEAIDSDYIGSSISRRSSSDLSVSGAQITAPAGYYESAASASVATGVINYWNTSVTEDSTKRTYTKSPNYTPGYFSTISAPQVQLTKQTETITPSQSTQTVTPTGDYYYIKQVTVNPIPSEYIIPSGNKAITQNGTGIDVAAYSTVSVNVSGGAPVLQDKTVNPSESQQVISADSGYDGLDEVTVTAISSSYVGSGITRRSSSDLTASGATVTVPSGYYSSQATKSVANGTAGTPTATKGTVSNHSISVTPSVTNTTGYIAGSTKTGTAVTVSASELVSETLQVASNGTSDVTNYASVNVQIPIVTYYTGSSAPSSSLGSVGDIYLQS